MSNKMNPSQFRKFLIARQTQTSLKNGIYLGSKSWKKGPYMIKPTRENPIEVLFEDEFTAVVNKPAGWVCHPNKMFDFFSLINQAQFIRFFKIKKS